MLHMAVMLIRTLSGAANSSLSQADQTAKEVVSLYNWQIQSGGVDFRNGLIQGFNVSKPEFLSHQQSYLYWVHCQNDWAESVFSQ